MPTDATVQPETAQALSHTLVRVMKIMSAMKHQAPRQHPAVDPSHYPVLFSLSGTPQRVSAVADTIHSDVSTVSRQVSHLVQHGLLEKIGDPDDGRARLSLSPSGREVIEKLVRGRGEWFGQPGLMVGRGRPRLRRLPLPVRRRPRGLQGPGGRSDHERDHSDDHPHPDLQDHHRGGLAHER